MKNRGSSSSVGSSTRMKQPHFLMGLLGREAETYADAYLISQEGKMFPVVRSLLAMKCSFFKEKFFPGSSERKSRTEDPDIAEPENYADDTGMQTVYASLDGTTGAIADTMEPNEGSTAAATAGMPTLATEEASAMSGTAPTSGKDDISPTQKEGATGTVESSEVSAAPKGGQETGRTSSPKRVESAVQAEGLGSSDSPARKANSSSLASPGHTKPSYPMPFPMTLLKQVVEFIYTDYVTFLDELEVAMKPWRGAPNVTHSPIQPTCAVVSHIVELARAADYVELKELCLRCCIMLRMVVKTRRSTACAALGAIRRRKDNPFFLNKMASLLVKYINGDVKKSFSVVPCNKSHVSGQEAGCHCFGAFGLCTVMHLNGDALEEVISAQTRGFSDEYMLQVVYFWATGGKRLSSLHTDRSSTVLEDNESTAEADGSTGNLDDVSSEPDPNFMDLPAPPASEPEPYPLAEDDIPRRGIPLVCPKTTTPNSETRFTEGKEMTTKFNLSEMNPNFLYEYVENSGLVDKQTLYNVYRYRALTGPRFARIFSMRRRSYPPRGDHMSGVEE